MPDFVQTLFSHASQRGSRSTALHSLQWVTVALLAALVYAATHAAPTWLSGVLGLGFGVFLFAYLGTHFYLLVKNPDALRSESYTLRKMEIEKGMLGDSMQGMRDVREIGAQVRPALTVSNDQP